MPKLMISSSRAIFLLVFLNQFKSHHASKGYNSWESSNHSPHYGNSADLDDFYSKIHLSSRDDWDNQGDSNWNNQGYNDNGKRYPNMESIDDFTRESSSHNHKSDHTYSSHQSREGNNEDFRIPYDDEWEEINEGSGKNYSYDVAEAEQEDLEYGDKSSKRDAPNHSSQSYHESFHEMANGARHDHQDHHNNRDEDDEHNRSGHDDDEMRNNGNDLSNQPNDSTLVHHTSPRSEYANHDYQYKVNAYREKKSSNVHESEDESSEEDVDAETANSEPSDNAPKEKSLSSITQQNVLPAMDSTNTECNGFWNCGGAFAMITVGAVATLILLLFTATRPFRGRRRSEVMTSRLVKVFTCFDEHSCSTDSENEENSVVTEFSSGLGYEDQEVMTPITDDEMLKFRMV
mmetsp:Transcript_22130/g.33449  ORF Transcript_22130/g.33449 Transcript_22130/m.33449 type:complete len:403 (+) Transcript_22130:152-1360(+)